MLGTKNPKEISKQKELFSNCYQTIHNIKELKPLVKLVVIATQGGHSYANKFSHIWEKLFKIYADPTRNTVEHLELTNCNAVGVFAYKNIVCIGSKRTEKEVCGTLLHELIHFVTQEIFDNSCNPYPKGDKTEQMLDEMCTELRNNPLLHEIINKLYTYERENWHNEFVVRLFQYIISVENYDKAFNTLKELHPKIPDFINNYLAQAKKHLSKLESLRFKQMDVTIDNLKKDKLFKKNSLKDIQEELQNVKEKLSSSTDCELQKREAALEQSKLEINQSFSC